MNRRDFIKGMMALAGVAAVGLPELDTVTAAPVPVVAQGAQPSGDGIAVDGVWYAVDEWELKFLCEPIELPPLAWGEPQPFKRYMPGPVTRKMACMIQGDIGRLVHMPDVSLPFTLSADAHEFSGTAKVMGSDGAFAPSGAVAHYVYFDIETIAYNA